MRRYERSHVAFELVGHVNIRVPDVEADIPCFEVHASATLALASQRKCHRRVLDSRTVIYGIVIRPLVWYSETSSSYKRTAQKRILQTAKSLVLVVVCSFGRFLVQPLRTESSYSICAAQNEL